jgi:hypothetical protein
MPAPTSDRDDWSPAAATGVELRARVFVEHDATELQSISTFLVLPGHNEL